MTKNTASSPSQVVQVYIENIPEQAQPLFNRLRTIIIGLLPEASEVVSYGVLGYKLDPKKRAAVFIAGWKDHIAIYPVPKDVGLCTELAPYIRGKGTLWFPLDAALPEKLIIKTVKALCS